MEWDFEVGQKVLYSTVFSGTVKAVITERVEDLWLGDRYMLRVTSRNNPTYPVGMEVGVHAKSTFLAAR
jgi:hypothetical protein